MIQPEAPFTVYENFLYIFTTSIGSSEGLKSPLQTNTEEDLVPRCRLQEGGIIKNNSNKFTNKKLNRRSS
jgi:hypothetical protein